MSLSADKVVAASNAWTWIPDNATTEATEGYLLVRFPDYFDHPLELLRFTPSGRSGAALATAVRMERSWRQAAKTPRSRCCPSPRTWAALASRS